MKLEYSPTYYKILDLLFKTEHIKSETYATSFEGGTVKRIKNEHKTINPNQDGITITDSKLFSKCTPAQWYLVGTISEQLKMNNALWEFPVNLRRNGNSCKALKGLKDMNIVIATETTHIYIVNPLYIRRGNFYAILTTTADILSTCVKVLPQHIVTKKSVKDFKPTDDYNLPSVGYGEVKNIN